MISLTNMGWSIDWTTGSSVILGLNPLVQHTVGTVGWDRLSYICGRIIYTHPYVHKVECENTIDSHAAYICHTLKSERFNTGWKSICNQCESLYTRTSDVIGVSVRVAGRFDGAQIAQSICWFVGKTCTSTLTQSVEHVHRCVHTLYGQIGVKLTIYRTIV